MKVKLFEILDRMTFFPAIAIQVSGDDGYLARRAGYGPACVLFSHLGGGRLLDDPYAWNDRTYKTAHVYIDAHFDELADGAVIDVEHILGETAVPKLSESMST